MIKPKDDLTVVKKKKKKGRKSKIHINILTYHIASLEKIDQQSRNIKIEVGI